MAELEAVAFVTGLLSVWLTQRMHIANWPIGIVSVACFAWLFFDAELYADAALQLVFIVLGAYGWWRWAREQAARQQVQVTRVPHQEALLGLAAAMLSTGACAWLLTAHTDSPLPWPDAAVLSFSLLATWAQARGRLECWWVWIAVDVVSIPLYWSRALPLTAGLYVLFLALCIAGVRSWGRRLQGGQVAA